MANEKLPSGVAAKRTPTPRTTRAKTTADVPVTEAPAPITKARSAVNPRTAGIDLDAVRRRAYELYEERGRLDGYDEQDWYTAEQELRGRKQSRSQNGGRGADSKRSA